MDVCVSVLSTLLTMPITIRGRLDVQIGNYQDRLGPLSSMPIRVGNVDKKLILSTLPGLSGNVDKIIFLST